MHIHVYVYVCIFACIHVYIYVYVHIYIYINNWHTVSPGVHCGRIGGRQGQGGMGGGGGDGNRVWSEMQEENKSFIQNPRFDFEPALQQVFM